MLNLGLFTVDARALTFLVALLALNIFVLWVIRRISLSVHLSDILAEKDPSIVNARADAMQAHLQYVQGLKSSGLMNDPPATPNPPIQTDPDPASYSRMSGVLGSLVLVAALWALANFLAWASFWKPEAISQVLKHAGTFFLSGSALFAPYAFNQLGSIFRAQPKQ